MKKQATFRREGYGELYIILLPSLLLLVIFKYIPMAGILIAFRDFNIFVGFTKSPFVGLEHFQNLFRSEEFYRIVRNTLISGLVGFILVMSANAASRKYLDRGIW